MSAANQLKIEEMTEEEAIELLGARSLGRIAYSFRDQVDIRPLMYVLDDRWIFGRSAGGEKLRTLRHNRWVALAVDEVEDFWHWRSVVVRGALQFFGERGDAEDMVMRERALRAIRKVIPEALTDEDPAGDRTFLFGIAVQEISGRKATLVQAR